MSNQLPVRLFIGSSAEGLAVAHHLQAVLESRYVCEVEVWDQGTFKPSSYTLDALAEKAASVDFAVLVASPDDVTKSRGVEEPSVRDNIVLEFGLFTGALGRRRTYLLVTGGAKLPTDVLGLTRLPYRPRTDNNLRAAVNDAALQIQEQVRDLGRLARATTAHGRAPQHDSLAAEIEALSQNARAQGWTVRKNSATTLRLQSPKGKIHTMSKGQPDATRTNLRRFAAELRATGLRVNNGIRRPVGSPPSRPRRVPLQGAPLQGDGHSNSGSTESTHLARRVMPGLGRSSWVPLGRCGLAPPPPGRRPMEPVVAAHPV